MSREHERSIGRRDEGSARTRGAVSSTSPIFRPRQPSRTRSPSCRASSLYLAVAMCCLPSAVALSQSAEDLVASGHVMIRARVEPERVLVGQRAELKVEVLTRTWFLAAPAFPTSLEIEGAVVLRPDTFGVNYTERIGSETYAVQARSYAVFPVRTGRLDIAPVEVTLVVAQDDASRSPPIALRSPSLGLESALPEGARGLGLVVATPLLTVEQTWSRSFDGLRVGDAVERTVSQRVESSVAMVLPAPVFTAPDRVATYPERPRLDTRTGRGELSGSRIDAATYVFEQEGTFTLSEIIVHWWDLGAGELRTETLPGATFAVGANSELADDQLSAPEDELPEDESDPESARAPWQWFLGAIALLALLLAVRRPIGRILTAVRDHLRRTPEPERKAFLALRRALRSGDDAAAVLAPLYRWRDTLDAIPGPPTLEALAAWADDTALAVELGAVLAAAGGGGGTWHPRRLLAAVVRVRRLAASTAGRGRAAHGELPPLNPRKGGSGPTSVGQP